MMGTTHAACGVLAFGGATVAIRFGWSDLALGSTLTAGAAMLNDLDHRNASATKSLGPISWLAHWPIHWIFGDHRHGTHSLLFVAIVALGAQSALDHRHDWYAAAGLCLLMALAWSSGIRLFGIPGRVDDFVSVPISIWLVYFTDWDLRIVPAALALGALTHIAGDCLTDRGCPLWWPLKATRYNVRMFTTNTAGETVAMVLVCLGILGVCVWHAYRLLTG
jgi:membrane-bound metal-dependent hydrolase YbcI (DUF457 family)